jgi:hypothetical protein
MAKWCTVRVTFDPRGYGQSYKRDIAVHNHGLNAAFIMAAKADSLGRINAQRPPNNQVALDALGTTDVRSYMDADPGPNYRLI